MNCCDYDCTQGRDCPARVAKVSRRTPAAEPLPPSTWRARLRDLARAMLLTALAAVLAMVFLALVGCTQHRVREVCGTLADGSGYCVLLGVTRA